MVDTSPRRIWHGREAAACRSSSSSTVVLGSVTVLGRAHPSSAHEVSGHDVEYRGELCPLPPVPRRCVGRPQAPRLLLRATSTATFARIVPPARSRRRTERQHRTTRRSPFEGAPNGMCVCRCRGRGGVRIGGRPPGALDDPCGGAADGRDRVSGSRVDGAPESSARYKRPFASLYRRSTSPGMRPRAGTARSLSFAHARITLGSRVAFAFALSWSWRNETSPWSTRAAARLPVGGDGAACVPVLVERFGQRGHVRLRELEFAPVPVPAELNGLCTLGSVEVVNQHFDRCFRHCLPFHQTTSDAIGTVCGQRYPSPFDGLSQTRFCGTSTDVARGGQQLIRRDEISASATESENRLCRNGSRGRRRG